jgi:hypothetical protein
MLLLRRTLLKRNLNPAVCVKNDEAPPTSDSWMRSRAYLDTVKLPSQASLGLWLKEECDT